MNWRRAWLLVSLGAFVLLFLIFFGGMFLYGDPIE